MQKLNGAKYYSQIDLRESGPAFLILPTPKEDEIKGNNLLDDAYSLLVSILKAPLLTTSERYKELGMGVKKGTLLIHDLVNQKLIEAVPVSTSYARIILYKLTDKAKVLLIDKGEHIEKFPHSLPHEFGVNLIVQFYEKQGLRVHREVQCEDGFIDVVVFNEDKKLLVEFETGKSDIAKNISKCLAFDDRSKIIMVGMNTAVNRKIETVIENNKLHSKRIEIKLLGEFRYGNKK